MELHSQTRVCLPNAKAFNHELVNHFEMKVQSGCPMFLYNHTQQILRLAGLTRTFVYK